MNRVFSTLPRSLIKQRYHPLLGVPLPTVLSHFSKVEGDGGAVTTWGWPSQRAGAWEHVSGASLPIHYCKERVGCSFRGVHLEKGNQLTFPDLCCITEYQVTLKRLSQI